MLWMTGHEPRKVKQVGCFNRTEWLPGCIQAGETVFMVYFGMED